MKRVLIWGGVALTVSIIVIVAGFFWASASAQSALSATYTAHEVDFPVPMPLADDEVPEGVDPDALALERAIERGRHLTSSRYACADCHGEDFGGGVMVDDPAMGRLLGPNLTLGEGSVTRNYTATDWDRIVRHGIRKDGRPALMPSEDFVAMSDRELSDIVAYIRSLPPVDHVVPESTLGPVGTVLLATGRFQLSVHRMADHEAPHQAEPPVPAETAEFGAHLAKVCTGCHRENFEGGPIVQGPPDWPHAKNLTPHQDGLSDYDYPAFAKVMREGVRPNGERVRDPMTLVTPYAARMTETELKALWLYLRTVAPVPTGR